MSETMNRPTLTFVFCSLWLGQMKLASAVCSAANVQEQIKANGKDPVDFATLRAKPNIIIFLADDMGYSDLASYGNPSVKKNFIDDFALGGIRFQSTYAADSLCSPARAGLLTGRLPIRNGVVGYEGVLRVFGVKDTGGLPRNEATIATVLKAAGYHTGFAGKWHLGINKYSATDGTYLPRHYGFDFVGTNLPMSNIHTCDESEYWMKDGPSASDCFLYNGTEIIQQPVNFTGLTDKLTDDFGRFINNVPPYSPFFFYFSFPQVHNALFSWKSGRKLLSTGMYSGDLAEMAEAIKDVMDKVEESGKKEDTLVIFMSDHGPHKELCTEGGASTGFRGGKASSFEGGFRIPFILSWPRYVKPGQISDSVISTLDLLPTFAALVGSDPPKVVLDGSDIRGHIFDSALSFYRRPIFYYCNQMLMAVRSGRFKFHYRTIPLPTLEENDLNCPNGLPLEYYYHHGVVVCTKNLTISHNPPLVYNLMTDPAERFSLKNNSASDAVRRKVERLIDELEKSLEVDRRSPQLGNYENKTQPCCNPPDCHCNYDGKFVQ